MYLCTYVSIIVIIKYYVLRGQNMSLLDKKTMNEIKYYLPTAKTCMQLGNFFSVFADPTRLRIISALAISPMCVTDMASALAINQTTLSHQLKLLRDADVVRFDRQGKVLFYSIANSLINQLLLFGVEYISEDEA